MPLNYSSDFLMRSGLTDHHAITSMTQLANGFVRVDRRDAPSVTVAALNVARISADTVADVLQDGSPTCIVLIPKRSHYDWEGRDWALRHGSTVQTFSELFNALNDEDPRPYLDKNVAFNTRALAQHSRVTDLEMICEASFVLHRSNGVDLEVALDYQYEFTQEALVNALSRHPTATVFLNMNPNGRPTSAALSHDGGANSIEIHRLGELMSRLHRA